MKKIILPLIIAFSFSAGYSQEKNINVQSKIEQVTVFLSGAQIERHAEAAIPAGTSRLVFTGLSPEIDPQTIQVKGQGTFTILAVNRESNFLKEQEVNTQLKQLEEQRSDINDKITSAQNQIAILKAQEEMLGKNQVVSGNNTGLELEKLKQALNYYQLKMTEVKNEQMSVQKRISKLQEEQAKLQKQINDIKGKSLTNTSDIVVKVSAEKAVKGTFTLTYLVKNASWYPTYELRAQSTSQPINLIYKANVSQQSGEDWNNVKLALSSGDPAVGGNRPELQPYYIGYNIINTGKANLTAVSGRVTAKNDGSPLPGVSVKVKGTSIATVTDVSGNYSLQLPGGQQTLEFAYIGYLPQEIPVRSAVMNAALQESTQSLDEVVVVGYDTQKLQGKASGVMIRGNAAPQAQSVAVEAQQQQTNFQFAIKAPYTIKNDGKQYSVDVGRFELPASYQYSAIAKLSSAVYLQAKAADFDRLNLLSGEANIFFEGTFLGKTLIDMQQAADTLNISLGTDKSIVIERKQEKEFQEKQFIGSSVRAVREFVITIQNRKSEPVNLIVEDQIPVSTSGEVVVEKQEFPEGKLDEKTGKVTWVLNMPANGQKQLHLKYQVKYPKNKPITLE